MLKLQRGGHVDATNSGMPQVPSLRAIASQLLAARIQRRALQGLLALALYLGVFVAAFALPLVSHLNVPNIRQYWTDPNFYAWAMRWWPYAVSHLTNPLHSSQIGAPHGYDLAWASTTPSVDLLMWPVTAAFGVVVLTHRGNAGMLFQAATGFYFRIAGGYINASLTPVDAIPHALTLVADPSGAADRMLADYLRSAGVGAILVEQAWEDPWMRNLVSKLHMHGLPAGGVSVYPVRPWLASQARSAQLSHQAHEAHLYRQAH